jgi:hypothetical protein
MYGPLGNLDLFWRLVCNSSYTLHTLLLHPSPSVMVSTTKSASFFVMASACFINHCQPFTPSVPSSVHRQKFALVAASSTASIIYGIIKRHFKSRQSLVTCLFAATFGIAAFFKVLKAVIAADGKLYVILGQLKEGTQMHTRFNQG